MVVLRDGRKLIGTLRSFDQFGNYYYYTCINIDNHDSYYY